MQVLPRFELGLLDSKSRVLTIAPYRIMEVIVTKIYFNHISGNICLPPETYATIYDADMWVVTNSKNKILK